MVEVPHGGRDGHTGCQGQQHELSNNHTHRIAFGLQDRVAAGAGPSPRSRRAVRKVLQILSLLGGQLMAGPGKRAGHPPHHPPDEAAGRKAFDEVALAQQRRGGAHLFRKVVDFGSLEPGRRRVVRVVREGTRGAARRTLKRTWYKSHPMTNRAHASTPRLPTTTMRAPNSSSLLEMPPNEYSCPTSSDTNDADKHTCSMVPCRESLNGENEMCRSRDTRSTHVPKYLPGRDGREAHQEPQTQTHTETHTQAATTHTW